MLREWCSMAAQDFNTSARTQHHSARPAPPDRHIGRARRIRRVCLPRQKDRLYSAVALIVLLLLAYGLA